MRDRRLLAVGATILVLFVVAGAVALAASGRPPATWLAPLRPSLTGACAERALPTPGPGQFRAPSGRLVTPAGGVLSLPSLPLGVAVSPDGQWAATTNNDRGATVSLVRLSPLRVERQRPVSSAFVGVVFSPDGQRLYVSSGGGQSVFVFRVVPAGAAGNADLVPDGEIPVSGYPAGLAVSPDGRELYVARNLHSTIAVVELASRSVVAEVGVGMFPYSLAVAPDGERLYAAHWLGREVSVVDVRARRLEAAIAVGSRPTGLAVSPDGKRLFTANATSDDLTIVDTERLAVVQTLPLAPVRGAKYGSSPNGVALSASPNGLPAYVTLAGNDAVAVVDAATPRAAGPGAAAAGPAERYEVRGMLPTGWYPTGAALAPGGRGLVVISAKGLGAGPVARPGIRPNGTLQLVPAPSQAELAALTARVLTNNLLVADGSGVRPVAPCVDLPELRSRIKHVVYILKENRTFDQVLGDLPGVDGEPRLTIFGAEVTPNHHALATEFATSDRFFVNGEVSATGHMWSTAGTTTDYLERTWPQYYYYTRLGRPDDQTTTRAIPPGGLIFDAAAAAGVSFRVYGEMFYDIEENPARPESGAPDATPTPRPRRSLLPSLRDRLSPNYPSYDISIPDQRRADVFLAELAQFEAAGELPSLLFLWLPNDHTAGVQAGVKTPRAYLADNDLALGRIVEGLSRTRFWKDMLILVTEDDAQDGPDHVDSHRTIFLAIGPLVKRGYVSHVQRDQVSLLRTIELILGIPPFSQLDTQATPILDIFADQPDVRPYRARPATWPLDEVSTATAPGQATAANLAVADDMDDAAFSAVVWEGVTGTPYEQALQIIAAARLEAIASGSAFR